MIIARISGVKNGSVDVLAARALPSIPI